MFGLNEISWRFFLQVIVYALCAWYLTIFVFAWIKDKNRQKEVYFEDYNRDSRKPENLQPIKVSSKDFPSEIISITQIEEVPLAVTFYEETGLDEGYGIDYFFEDKNSILPALMENIQYQQ